MQEVKEEISKLPRIYFKSRELTSFKKFLNLAYEKKVVLDSFLYEKGNIKLIMKDGKSINSSLSDTVVYFSKNNGLIYVTVKNFNDKIQFYEVTNFNQQEWEVIYKVLSLAGTTYGVGIFSNWNKNIGKVNSILKIIKFLQ